MKVGVLGATGKTGIHVVEQALAAGHQVVALVRSPEKLQIKHEALEVKKVDLYSKPSLVDGFIGCDQIVSCLGGQYRWTEFNVTFYTDTTAIIIAALKEARVKRFIMMSAAFAKKTPGEPFFVWAFVRPAFLGAVLRNMSQAEEELMREIPGINVTIVKPPGLNNNPLDDQDILTAVGREYVPDGNTMMSRAQVAKFMVQALTNNTWDNKSLAVATKK